jgi:hypothetical protein
MCSAQQALQSSALAGAADPARFCTATDGMFLAGSGLQEAAYLAQLALCNIWRVVGMRRLARKSTTAPDTSMHGMDRAPSEQHACVPAAA